MAKAKTLKAGIDLTAWRKRMGWAVDRAAVELRVLPGSLRNLESGRKAASATLLRLAEVLERLVSVPATPRASAEPAAPRSSKRAAPVAPMAPDAWEEMWSRVLHSTAKGVDGSTVRVASFDRADAVPAAGSTLRRDGGAALWSHHGLVMGEIPSVCFTGLRPRLRDHLEPGPVPVSYHLSARAAAGILRRSARLGRRLPEPIEAAFRAVADGRCSTAALVPATVVGFDQRNFRSTGDAVGTLTAGAGDSTSSQPLVLGLDAAGGYVVRRLTPTEGLRLQGFPSDHFDGVFFAGERRPATKRSARRGGKLTKRDP